MEIWRPNWHRTQPNRPDALDCADRKEPTNQSLRCWPDRTARLQHISRPPRSTAPAPLRVPRIADSMRGRNRGDIPFRGRRPLRSRRLRRERGDAGNWGKAGRRDRGGHSRGVRGELVAARRPQRLSDRERRARPWRFVRQCRMLQRLVRHAGRDARCRVECSGLALRPASPVGAALELSAGARAVAAAVHPRRHAGKGAGGGPRLTPARRADARSIATAGQRGWRR